MSDLDDQLDRALADGKISLNDADEARRFSEFLRESGPGPGKPGYEKQRWWAAYHKHYPEDAKDLEAEIQRRRAIPPDRETGSIS